MIEKDIDILEHSRCAFEDLLHYVIPCAMQFAFIEDSLTVLLLTTDDSEYGLPSRDLAHDYCGTTTDTVLWYTVAPTD